MNDWRRGSPPSYPPFTDEHLKRLVSIAEDDQKSFFEQNPAGGVPSAPLVDRAVPGARCIYVDCKKNAKKTNGVKDLDVTTSMTRDSVAFPAARRRAGRRPHGKGLLVESRH